jgi:hypothetical protein
MHCGIHPRCRSRQCTRTHTIDQSEWSRDNRYAHDEIMYMGTFFGCAAGDGLLALGIRWCSQDSLPHAHQSVDLTLKRTPHILQFLLVAEERESSEFVL